MVVEVHRGSAAGQGRNSRRLGWTCARIPPAPTGRSYVYPVYEEESGMKKVVMLALALMVAAAPAFAQDKKAAKKSEGAAAEKTMSAAGTVSAVTADSLTVKGKTGDMTFAVDAKTTAQATGASHKTASAKADNKPTPI